MANTISKLMQTAGNVSGIISTAVGGIQAAGQLFKNQNNINAREDRRQLEQQSKLNELNTKSNKELADYEQELKLKMWKDTNYAAQLKQAEIAGVSKAAVLGGSGTGTQGASVNSSGIGGGAANSAASQGTNIQQALAAAQIANLAADTQKKTAEAEKTNADTKGIGITTESNQFDLSLKKALKDNNILLSDSAVDIAESNKKIAQLTAQEAGRQFSALTSVITQTADKDNDPLIKAKRAELEIKVKQLENLINENKNKIKEGILKTDEHELNEIKKEIEGFQADLSGIGINNTTTKIILSILGKAFGVRTK